MSTTNKFSEDFQKKFLSLQNKLAELEKDQQQYIIQADELKKSEERFKTLVDSAPIGIYYSDLYGKFLYGNKQAEEIIGYRQDEVVGKNYLKLRLLKAGDMRKAVKLLALNRLGKGTGPDKFTLRRSDGTNRSVEITTRIISLDNCKVVLGMVQDFTVRKQTKKALNKIELRFRELAESITDIFFAFDKNLKYTYWNLASEKFTGIKAADALGKSFSEIFPELQGGFFEQKYLEVLKTRQPVLFENTLTVGDKTFHFEINAYPTKEGVSVIAKDITARKTAEKKLQNSLKEKEIFFQEIHHRTKNNLQIVSSLINIQADTFPDSEFNEKLKALRNRIESMSMIHNSLFKTEDPTKIDCDLFVHKLTSQLLHSYGVKPGRIKICIETSNVHKGIKQVIPCALIINELVTNSIKHAFPDDRQGTIFITVWQDPQGILHLQIGDNGIGLPKDLDISNLNSLGLKLVYNLVKQQQGKIAVVKENDKTSFDIQLPSN